MLPLCLYLTARTDDSDAMIYTNGGSHVKTVQKILELISSIYGLARNAGIVSVRFFNSRMGKRNVTAKKVRTVIKGHDFGGTARIGTELKKKIIDRFVPNEPGRMKKPLLVVIITNGIVSAQKQYGFILDRDHGADTFTWSRSMASIHNF